MFYVSNSSFVLTPSGRNHIYLGLEGDGGGSQVGGSRAGTELEVG